MRPHQLASFDLVAGHAGDDVSSRPAHRNQNNQHVERLTTRLQGGCQTPSRASTSTFSNGERLYGSPQPLSPLAFHATNHAMPALSIIG